MYFITYVWLLKSQRERERDGPIIYSQTWPLAPMQKKVATPDLYRSH